MRHDSLLQAGYLRQVDSDVWIQPNYQQRETTRHYESEVRIADLIKNARCIHTLSDELRVYHRDAIETFHLSPQRANLLRPVKGVLKGNILEIGAGCGALTRFMGECGANVTALEPQLHRAHICRLRTRDLSNIDVIHGVVDDYLLNQQYDAITMIDIMQDAHLYASPQSPINGLIERAYKMLKPEGALIITATNSLAPCELKLCSPALSGYQQNHLNLTNKTNHRHDIGCRELTSILEKIGFNSHYWMAPFPNLRQPTAIISEKGFLEKQFDTLSLILSASMLSAEALYDTPISWDNDLSDIIRNRMGMDLATSFLIVASRQENASAEHRLPLAWHYATTRLEKYCKHTTFELDDDQTITVHSERAEPFSDDQISPRAHHDYSVDPEVTAHTIRPPTVHYATHTKDHYIKGTLLSIILVKLLTKPVLGNDDLKAIATQYLNAITVIIRHQTGRTVRLDSPYAEVPPKFLDLTPRNIVIDRQRAPHPIDQEWQSTSPLLAGYLLFRSMVNMFQSVTTIGIHEPYKEITPAQMLKSLFHSVEWNLSDALILEYAKRETQHRKDIFGDTSENAGLVEWLYTANLNCEALSEADITLHPDRAQSGDRITQNESKVDPDAHFIVALPSQFDSLRHEVAQLEYHKRSNLTRDRELQATRDEHKRATIYLEAFEKRMEQLSSELHDATTRVAETTQLLRFVEQKEQALRNSTSWRITAPARKFIESSRSLFRSAGASGGRVVAVSRRIAYLAYEHILCLLKECQVRRQTIQSRQPSLEERSPETRDSDSRWLPTNNVVTPSYVDPRLDLNAVQAKKEVHVCVYLHVQQAYQLIEAVLRLRNVPAKFDLYIALPPDAPFEQTADFIRENTEGVQNLRLLCSFSSRSRWTRAHVIDRPTQSYDIIGRFFFGNFGGTPHARNWQKRAMDSLLGPPASSGGRITHFFNQLSNGVDIIYPPQSDLELKFQNSETDNATETPREQHEFLFDASPSRMGYHEPSVDMSWHSSAFMAKQLHRPLQGTSSSTRELHLRDGLDRTAGPDYEPQQDYSQSILHTDLRILAYFLPQFHTIRENDAWHGEGFTEWHSVRSASPLFAGHYQQHVPHPDIGYYALNGESELRRIREMMEKAGIEGLIFYHYWFEGRRILDSPARLLLSCPDIALPFCFCWANENWTRRWDGDEDDILIHQTYSSEDARSFIKYLIPFFRDARYISVGERPLLFVYRPSDLPHDANYIDIWRDECNDHGIKPPYVVAVLTRGASDPRHYGMEAGCERVLHDWTDGAVPDIRNSLDTYAPLTGSVLNYEDVYRHYANLHSDKPFTWIRSVVPMWDNTARYGAAARVLFGATPEIFQRWIEAQLLYSKQRLACEQRFLIVNAWNEWAEGARLEPDTRFGYAWLNAIGRSLSGMHYASELNAAAAIPSTLVLRVSMPASARKAFDADPWLRSSVAHALRCSTVFERCKVTLDDEIVELFGLADLRVGQLNRNCEQSVDMVLELKSPCLFGPKVLEQMLESALKFPGACICPNAYIDSNPLFQITPLGGLNFSDTVKMPLLMYPRSRSEHQIQYCRVRTDAHCIAMDASRLAPSDRPSVTTIIRIHHNVDIELLRKTVSCIAAMENCRCRPLVAAQDVPESIFAEVRAMLSEFLWHEDHEPIFEFFSSTNQAGDLRAMMLTECIRNVDTRYVGVLDHDDLLMPSCYAWLIERMRLTGKAVSFGRVYATAYAHNTGVRLARKKDFEYGSSYEDFLYNNHAPVHSFLIDTYQFDFDTLVYFDDQVYMEDYALTLQLFTLDNCDWSALELNHYVGDYIHSVDREHTLATSQSAREALLHCPAYQRDSIRINYLKRLLHGKSSAMA